MVSPDLMDITLNAREIEVTSKDNVHKFKMYAIFMMLPFFNFIYLQRAPRGIRVYSIGTSFLLCID